MESSSSFPSPKTDARGDITPPDGDVTSGTPMRQRSPADTAGGDVGTARSASQSTLPETMRLLFWDCPFDRLRLSEFFDFIVGRILAEGSWDQVLWLRRAIGDAQLRGWLLRDHGRTLSRKQLRFWQLVLDLPADEVARWLAARSDSIWDNRMHS